MRHFSRGCFPLVLLALCGVASAAIVPVGVPFNVDIIRERGGVASPGPGTSGQAFVTQSEAAANDPVDPHGLPDNGILNLSAGSVRLGPYSGLNGLRVRPGEGFDINLTTGQGVTAVVLLVTATDHTVSVPFPPYILTQTSPLTFYVTQQFYTPAPKSFYSAYQASYFYDPYPQLGGMDTTGANGIGFVDSDHAGLSSAVIPIDTYFNGPLGGIKVFNSSTMSGENGTFYVLGGYEIVPEPAWAALLFMPVLTLRRARKPKG